MSNKHTAAVVDMSRHENYDGPMDPPSVETLQRDLEYQRSLNQRYRQAGISMRKCLEEIRKENNGANPKIEDLCFVEIMAEAWWL